jgi:hypothetical protein
MLLAVLVAVLGSAIATTPAMATRGLDVHIEALTDVSAPDQAGRFVASGPAVDAGLLCATGVVTSLWVTSASPDWQGAVWVLYMAKHFQFDDGTGFNARLVVRVIRITPEVCNTIGQWRIVDGTGRLKGTGTIEGFGDPVNLDLILDVYDGSVKE